MYVCRVTRNTHDFSLISHTGSAHIFFASSRPVRCRIEARVGSRLAAGARSIRERVEWPDRGRRRRWRRPCSIWKSRSDSNLSRGNDDGTRVRKPICFSGNGRQQRQRRRRRRASESRAKALPKAKATHLVLSCGPSYFQHRSVSITRRNMRAATNPPPPIHTARSQSVATPAFGGDDAKIEPVERRLAKSQATTFRGDDD